MLFHIPEIGKEGELVTLKENEARFLLLAKSAVYASPENIARMGENMFRSSEESFSSRFVATVRL